MADNSNSVNPKADQGDPRLDEFGRLWISGVVPHANELSHLLAKGQRQVTFIQDVSGPLMNAVQAHPEQVNWENLLDSAGRLTDHLQQQVSLLRGLVNSTASTFFAAGTAVASGTLNNWDGEDGYFHSTEQVFTVFQGRDIFRDQASDQLSRLSLDKTLAGKNAVEQLDMAWDVYLGLGNSSTSSLLTLRSAIDATIAELLRRRPTQRKAKTKQDKIVDIGLQLKEDFADVNDFHRLANDWDKLHDELSRAKSVQTRETEHRLIIKGTLFLIELLSALNPSKLR